MDCLSIQVEGSPEQESAGGHSPQDIWRLNYLWSLLRQLQEAKKLVEEDIQGLIDSLVL